MATLDRHFAHINQFVFVRIGACKVFIISISLVFKLC